MALCGNWEKPPGKLWHGQLLAYALHRKPRVVQIKSLLCCLCVKPVESMNECIAHTAAGTVNGGAGGAGCECQPRTGARAEPGSDRAGEAEGLFNRGFTSSTVNGIDG